MYVIVSCSGCHCNLLSAILHCPFSCQGYALQVAEPRKIAAHDLCWAEGISFTPLAVEVLGGWASQACSSMFSFSSLSISYS